MMRLGRVEKRCCRGCSGDTQDSTEHHGLLFQRHGASETVAIQGAGRKTDGVVGVARCVCAGRGGRLGCAWGIRSSRSVGVIARRSLGGSGTAGNGASDERALNHHGCSTDHLWLQRHADGVGSRRLLSLVWLCVGVLRRGCTCCEIGCGCGRLRRCFTGCSLCGGHRS